MDRDHDISPDSPMRLLSLLICAILLFVSLDPAWAQQRFPQQSAYRDFEQAVAAAWRSVNSGFKLTHELEEKRKREIGSTSELILAAKGTFQSSIFRIDQAEARSQLPRRTPYLELYIRADNIRALSHYGLAYLACLQNDFVTAKRHISTGLQYVEDAYQRALMPEEPDLARHAHACAVIGADLHALGMQISDHEGNAKEKQRHEKRYHELTREAKGHASFSEKTVE
ncbi:MAG: hypothetical protein R2940_09470 [Syntrophotaleaceae bacterium]